MRLKFVFTADFIIRTSDNGTEIYPNYGATGADGLGVETTGRYVVEHQKHLTGDYTFNRINSYQDTHGRLIGLGNLLIDLCYKGNNIIVTTNYKIRTVNPEDPFTVDQLITPITSALIDGEITSGYLKMVPIEGGRKYATTLKLKD